MARTTAKCEFMENAFPAGQLKLEGNFYVVEDDQGEHMIFSADEKGRLCLILKGQDGHNLWINLSDKFHLPQEETLSALAVSQNRDGQIHLVFAARQQDGSDKLFVLKPMLAARSEWTRDFDVSRDMFKGEQWKTTVRQILLGTSNDSSDDATAYPQIYLVVKYLERATEDIWAVSVDMGKGAWTNQKSFQMPCNPDQIVAKCVANLRLYRGLFVLYKENMASPYADHLRFVGLNPTKKNPILTTIVQKLPEGASCIASFENSEGFTDLIVSGKQLTWRSSQQCFTGSKDVITSLNDNSGEADLAQLRIAQSKKLLSVWSLTKDALLSYQEFNIIERSAPTARTPKIPLMTKDSGSDRFTALQNPTLGQKLFVIDRAGAMKMLEQDCQTAMWNTPIDIMIPDSNEMIEFKSHTVQVQVIDPESEAPLPKMRVNLWCLTSTELLINGVSARGSPLGQIVETDESGMLTVIIKAEKLSAPLLRVSDVGSSDKFLGGPALEIDPMSKLWSTVNGLKTKEDLKNMVLPDGTKFVKSGLDDAQLEKAAKTLQDLSNVKKEIASSATSSTSTAVTVTHSNWLDKAGDRLWGAWDWVCEHIKKGWNWVVEKVGKVWHFVVEIAGKMWNFVLENFPQVAAAIQSVLEAISEGWEWVKKKFEFLFSWGDILDVKNIFVNLTTQGLLWGVDAVSLLEIKLDDYFDDLRAKVRSLKGMKLPPEILKMKAGSDPELEKRARAERGESEVDNVSSSPASSYGTYHLKHSGGPEESKGKGQSSVQRLIQRLEAVWVQVEELVSRCKVNIMQLFKSKNITVDELLQTLGVDLMEDVVGVIQKIVVGVLGSVSDLILELTNGLNTAINIPILSPLYKKLTRGAKLTILDLLCLCLAIPATFVYKIVSGKKPSEINGIGDLIKYNAMKPELDTRMGRIAMEALGTDGRQSSSFISFASVDSAIPQANPSAPKPKKSPNQKQRDEINKSRLRFAQSSSIVGGLLKLGLPAGVQIWYTCYSWPQQMTPPSPYSLKRAIVSTAGKLVPWLLSFVGLLKLTKQELSTLDIDLDERFGDKWWMYRFQIWGMGAIPVIFTMAGKEVAYIVQLCTSIAQSGALALLQIESWASGPGYSVYLAIEEWAKASGKISSAISGITMGAGFTVAPVALVLTNAGTFLNIIRVGLENEGKREILITGLDVD